METNTALSLKGPAYGKGKAQGSSSGKQGDCGVGGWGGTPGSRAAGWSGERVARGLHTEALGEERQAEFLLLPTCFFHLDIFPLALKSPHKV